MLVRMAVVVLISLVSFAELSSRQKADKEDALAATTIIARDIRKTLIIDALLSINNQRSVTNSSMI